jgi:hypothetical protein
MVMRDTGVQTDPLPPAPSAQSHDSTSPVATEPRERLVTPAVRTHGGSVHFQVRCI